MICPNCERRISEDDKFCGYCGAGLNFKEKESSYSQDQQERHIGIKYILRNHWKLVLCIGITLLLVWGIISNIGLSAREFPQLEEPKKITFEWEYGGSKYIIRETFYKTVYDYYKLSPDKDCWQEYNENCLRIFLEEAEEDNTISKIASNIKAVASKNGLSGDELLELTVAFVQSIPYDEDRLELIKYPGKLEDLYPRYPYEVLYDNEGVCTGKTFLAASLIEELGYGVALFDYDSEIEGGIGHIVPAIQCPKRYSSYDSGYCYTETTEEGFKIGDIPMDIDAGMPKTRTTIKLFGEESVFDFDELKDAKIYVITHGNSYQEIINTVQTIQKIEELEKEINKLYWVTSSLEEEATQLENSANYYNKQVEASYGKHLISGSPASYNEYSRLYSQYEFAYAKYEVKYNEYNRKVDQYNNLIYKYNALIEDFYE